jgi:hypothetical protein
VTRVTTGSRKWSTIAQSESYDLRDPPNLKHSLDCVGLCDPGDCFFFCVIVLFIALPLSEGDTKGLRGSIEVPK